MNKPLFIIGLSLLLLPLGFRWLQSRQQEDVIATFEAELEDKGKSELEESLAKAEKYNQRLFEEGWIDGEDYEQQLNLMGNGMMGSLTIPKIEVRLPIRHGTKEEVLADSVGHLKESSLPVGGENTHSVLTGHRGVPDAQLFTRLDELEQGDLFYVCVCGQKLCYRVCEIQTVRPEETEMTSIQSGRDLVSLVTCTPYGLNTHRLIVTGERVPEEKETEANVKKISKWDLLCCILAGVFSVTAVLQCVQKKRRKQMKRYLPILAAILLGICPLRAFAANGNIEVKVPEGQEGAISCSRVGSMINGTFVLEEAYRESGVDLNELKTAGQMEQAAKCLMKYEKSGAVFSFDKNGKTLISDLEEGVYLLHSFGKQEKEICPTLVFLPTWMESEKNMLYDVTVIPKFEEKQNVPKTGWDSRDVVYLGFLGISLIIIVGLSCHNRFKCGRIQFKHSEMGGYTNGNDNDAENPRCPRRFGIRGCRSVD